MLRVREAKGGGWRVEGTLEGERVRRSLKGVDRKQAEVMRVALEAAILKRERLGVTWGQVCDGYVANRRPAESTERRLERLKARFGGVDVGRMDLKEVRDWSVRQGHGDGMVRLVVGHARMVLNWGQRSGMYELARRPACELPEEPEARDRFLESVEEVEALVACAEDWFRPLVTFLFCTGARVGEARTLTWRDVDLAKGVVVLRTRKGRRGKVRARSVPLNGRMVSELKAMGPGRADARVFTAKRGGVLFAQSVYEPWRAMCEAAGVEDFNPHDARRTFATLLIRKGVDPFHIRQLLGHDSEGMLKRYAYLAPSHLRRVVELLE